MIRKNKWHIYVSLVVVIFGCLGLAYYAYGEWSTITIDQDKSYPVVYVVDGDTFKVKIGSKIVTIRLLGINTPETVDPRKPAQCYGPESSAAAKTLLSGQTVKLQLNPNREVTDKYGRFLAYAYLADGRFLNEYLLNEGYAREYTYGSPYMFQSEFRGLEQSAKIAKKGLWAKCDNN